MRLWIFNKIRETGAAVQKGQEPFSWGNACGELCAAGLMQCQAIERRIAYSQFLLMLNLSVVKFFSQEKDFCLAICTAGVCNEICIMSSAIDVNCLKPTTFIAHWLGSTLFVAEEGKKEFALPLHNRHM